MGGLVLGQEALPQQSVVVSIVFPGGAFWDPAGPLHASLPTGASHFFIQKSGTGGKYYRVGAKARQEPVPLLRDDFQARISLYTSRQRSKQAKTSAEMSM